MTSSNEWNPKQQASRHDWPPLAHGASAPAGPELRML